VAGLDVRRQPDGVKAAIGYATQEASVYRDLTVRENLEFRARLYLGPKAVRPAVERTLGRFGLGEFAQKLAGALSGGWRQRLALAQAVMHSPRVLFLDEPTTGLDPLSRRAIWDLVHEEARAGASVLVTTHYMDEAERCTRLALLYGGRVLATGTPAELKALAQSQARFAFARTQASPEALRAQPGVLEAWPSGDGVGLVIPEGALQTVRQDKSLVVEVYVDGSDPNFAFQAQAALRKALGDLNGRLLAGKALAGQAVTPPLTPSLHTLYNPDNKTAWFMIPGIIGLILTQFTVLLTALSIVREGESRMMETLIATPVKPYEVVLGKVLPYLGISFGVALLVLALGHWIFRVPVQGNLGWEFLWLDFLALSVFGALVLMLASSRFRKQLAV